MYMQSYRCNHLTHKPVVLFMGQTNNVAPNENAVSHMGLFCLRLGFLSGNFFLIATFPDCCLLLHVHKKHIKVQNHTPDSPSYGRELTQMITIGKSFRHLCTSHL